jgi:circadian clock protein KaiC
MHTWPPELLPSGVPGLDDVLGGGIPETSLTVVGGATGTGKTTLALQLAFANATAERPAVYFCGLAETAESVQQHLHQLKFFDTERLNRDVYLVDLGSHFSERDTSRVMDALARDVASLDPGVIIVDLPRTLTPAALRSEILAFLVCRVATSVLVDDCPQDIAELSAADNVIWLERTPSARSVEVLKVRGRSQMSGTHAVQLSSEGMRAFPRWPTPWRPRLRRVGERLSSGVEGIDGLLGGGIASGGAVLVEGTSGTGKTVLATQFVAECGHQGLPALVLLAEERPDRFIARAELMELQLERLVQGGLVDVNSLRGRDLSADELIHFMQRAVLGIGAQSVVIDSVAGLGLLVRDVRDFVWRAVDSLCGAGITVWLTHLGDAQLRPLVDDVVRLTRREEHRQIEVIKCSGLLSGSGVAAFEIGERGVEVLTHERVRPSNGHLVNYRFAG